MNRFRTFLGRLLEGLWLFLRVDGMILASSIAYSLAVSLFPMMLVLVAALGWALRFTSAGVNVQQQVLTAIEEQGSADLSQQVARTLDSVETNAGAGGLVGLATLLVTATVIFAQVDYAFDRLWEDTVEAGASWRRRLWNLVFRRLKALAMLLGLAGFVIAVMIASIVWEGVQSSVASAVTAPGWIDGVVQPVLQVGLNALAFAVCYRYLPKSDVAWRAALAGGLLTSVLWEIGRQVLSAYLVPDDLPSAYGVIGSFMAIMLWTYYAMLIVLFGAAYTRVLNEAPSAAAE